jgi:hypothetical protein
MAVLLFIHLHRGMWLFILLANSVDPDQHAHLCHLIWIYTRCAIWSGSTLILHAITSTKHSSYCNDNALFQIRYWRDTDNIRNAIDVDCERDTEGVIYAVQAGTLYHLRVLGYSLGGDGKLSSPETLFTYTSNHFISGTSILHNECLN